MEDDIDIYEDLPSFDGKQIETASKAIEEENAELKRQVAELTDKLERFCKRNETLEVNLCSLLKTAKAEIARKDRTIGELRKELDDALFKRGKYVNRGQVPSGPNRHQNGTETSKHERLQLTVHPDSFPEQTFNGRTEEPCKVERKSIEEESADEEKRTEDMRRNIDRASATVFGERLRKRLAEEEVAERNERLLKCSNTNNAVADGTNNNNNKGYVTESDKENSSRRAPRENERQPSTSKDSAAEHASSKKNGVERSVGKRPREETHDAEVVKRIKVEKGEEEVSRDGSRDGVSTRSQRFYETRYHSHRSSSRETQSHRRLNEERDKYRSSRSGRTESNYHEKREHSRGDKLTEKTRFSHDEVESERSHTDRSRDGYWHDHDYIDYHHKSRHKDRDYLRETSSERSSRRSRKAGSCSSDNRYRKERFDRSNSNHNENSRSSLTKHDDTLKNVSKTTNRAAHKTSSSSYKRDIYERGSNRESVKESKKRDNNECASRKIKIERSPETRRSKSLDKPNVCRVKKNSTCEVEKPEKVQDMGLVKDEPCANVQLDVSFEEGEILDAQHFSPAKNVSENVKNEEPGSTTSMHPNPLIPDLSDENENRTNQECNDNTTGPPSAVKTEQLLNSKFNDTEPETGSGENQNSKSETNEDPPLQEAETLSENANECAQECDKVQVLEVDKTQSASTINQLNDETVVETVTIPIELSEKDRVSHLSNTCETSKEEITKSEPLNGTHKCDDEPVKDVTVKKDTVALVGNDQTVAPIETTTAQTTDNKELIAGTNNVIRSEGSEGTVKKLDKADKDAPKVNCRVAGKITRARKASQSKSVSVSVKGKVIVVVRRRNPVKLADSNANMTVLVNSNSANKVSAATNQVRTSTELKSRSCKRTVDRSIGQAVASPDS